MTEGIGRRLLAELLGTAALTAAVVGSGIMAQRLSPGDAGLQLLQITVATVLALGALVTVLGPVSGAHLNPVVSLADWWTSRRGGGGLRGQDAAAYIVAQVLGAGSGAVLANAMFAVPTAVATTSRGGAGQLLGEVVATAGLVALVLALVRTGRTHLAAPAVAAWIGSAIWFTSSTAFANPAVTVGRALSDTATGIAPGGVSAYVAAQVVGAVLGVAVIGVLRPRPTPDAAARGPVAIEV